MRTRRVNLECDVVRLDFNRRLMLQFRGCVVTSDARLLAYRELDDALGLTVMAGGLLADARTGKNGRHDLIGMLRQSVFGRLAGYEGVNDAERLRHVPAMRWIVGGKAAQGCAASPSYGPFRDALAGGRETNLSALADLSGRWINLVHSRRPPRGIVLDMDSGVSPTHGEQEMSVWNGHYECICYHPLFVFNQFGDLERCVLRPGNVHSRRLAKPRRDAVVMPNRLPDGRGRHPTTNVPGDTAADRGTTTAAATSARVRRRSSRIQKHPTGGVRPNASENSQISPSTIARAARAAGSHPHLASVLQQGPEEREYFRQVRCHLGNT